jgi:pimeloyl-ACP methyl ester carboxylesterase
MGLLATAHPDGRTSLPRVGYRVSAMRIYLGHGASGSAATMAPWVDGLRGRGFEAHPLTLRRGRAEDALAGFFDQVPDEPDVVVGGHSFGGRVASLAAAGVGGSGAHPAIGVGGAGSLTASADRPHAGPATARAGDSDSPSGEVRRPRYAALVCLSYPLHRPGAPETWEARTAHWPSIAIPTLLLSGASDPFARISLLEAAMPALARGRLVTWPRLGHGLLPVREEVLDTVAAFLREVAAGA